MRADTNRCRWLRIGRRSAVRWLGVTIAMQSVAFVACSDAPARTPAEDSLALAHDSAAAASDTVFQATLAKYRRGQRVIDSIMRVARRDPILRTDSIYKAYRLALRPQGVSVDDVQRLNCLETAIAIRYGLVVENRVVKALRDTVIRDQGTTRGGEFYWSRAPSSGHVDSALCPKESIAAPSTMGGTRLDQETAMPSLTGRLK